MTVQGKGGECFDIQFQTHQEVVAWIRGLQNILRDAKMTVEGQDKKPAAAVETKSSQSTGKKSKGGVLEKHAKRYSVMAQSDAQKRLNPLTALRRGEQFTRYVKAANGVEVTSEEILLFCNVQEKKFYWCAGKKKTQIEGQSLSCADLTDIWIGKQTAELQQDKDLPRRNCFSVVSKTASLHLYAKDKLCVNRWLKGIETLLTSSGRDVQVDESSSKKKGARRFTVMATGALKRQSPIYQVLEGEGGLNMLVKGRVVKLFTASAAGVVTGNVVTVWLDAKKALLCWSAAGQVKSPTGSL
jgi:hypothetical protein